MARGKVAEWIRKPTAARKPAAGRRSKDNTATEPILAPELTPESLSSAASVAPRNRKAGGDSAPPSHSKSRAARSFLSAALRWRPRVNVVAVLCEEVVYHVMWLVESVVVVGRLIFFLMRFGFKQL